MKKSAVQNKNESRSNASAISKGGSKGFPAQFKLKRWKPNSGPSTEKEKNAETAANLISNEVDTAYDELNNNNLSDASDAFQALYLLRLNEYSKSKGKRGKGTMHPSTAAGYIIESKVTHRLSKTKGLNFQDTGMLSGTRPDVTVDLGDDQYGLVDITAQKSLGHIFNKKSNWTGHKGIPYVAEAWYPSIQFEGKASALTPEQIEEAERLAEERRDFAALVMSERIKAKGEEYVELQNRIQNEILNKGLRVANYLESRKRDMAALQNMGVDIEDGNIVLLNIEARNKLLNLTKEASELRPLPDYSPTRIEKVMSIIRLADRATEYKKSMSQRLRDREKREKKNERQKKRGRFVRKKD